MAGRRRARAWPPALEPGESVLLAGAASRARFWRTTGLGLLLLVPAAPLIALGAEWAIPTVLARPEPVEQPLLIAGGVGRVALLAIAIYYWEFLRRRGWMLTSRRLIQQGAATLPRAEIGRIARVAGGLVVHRDGPDEDLNGPRLHLAYLDDASGVQAALERLK